MTKASYRNILRTFMFQRSLKRYEKNNGLFTQTEVFILFSFLLAGGEDKFITLATIDKTMSDCNHSSSMTFFYQTCRELEIKGYLVKSSSPPEKYKLSVSGLNCLHTIEMIARKERYDR